jgi:energy-coupling factor transporter ATP-binding protein EcfA2
MAVEIEFDAYLRSLSNHYDKWWQLYTLTDAQTRTQQESSPFDFGLMVQTVAKGRSPNPNGSESQDKEKIEQFPVLEGIRKYVAEHRQVLLVGRSGSGKSTTSVRLLLEEAHSRQYIPVLVELRFWSGSILDRIQAFFQRHDLLLDRTQIEDLLCYKRLLLLMDGLNELPSEAARLDVMKFRQDHPKVSMIFTTRDLSLGGDFGLEHKLEMQPLTEAQMKDFVRSYVPEQAEAMLRQLKERLREFGETPRRNSADRVVGGNSGDRSSRGAHRWGDLLVELPQSRNMNFYKQSYQLNPGQIIQVVFKLTPLDIQASKVDISKCMEAPSNEWMASSIIYEVFAEIRTESNHVMSGSILYFFPRDKDESLCVLLECPEISREQASPERNRNQNVTMNFYGTVHGAAGTVQGDQNINPTEAGK